MRCWIWLTTGCNDVLDEPADYGLYDNTLVFSSVIFNLDDGIVDYPDSLEPYL